MLAELCPRAHARYTSLRLLGPHVEEFVVWLDSQGCPRLHIRRRLCAMPRLDARLRRRGVRRLEDLCAAELLRFGPRRSRDDVQLSGVVRSLVRYLDGRDLLAGRVLTPSEQLVAAYRLHLERVRGLAEKTQKLHSATAAALLAFVDFDDDPVRLRDLSSAEIEAFVCVTAARQCRESLQHTVAYLRSFLGFLASRNEVTRGLDASIDTPRVYRGERLPRALAWESVQSFLGAIDRSTPTGRRDHAMFLLMATYGLRSSEVAALRFDDIEWRSGRIRVPRPKTDTPLELPLTDEVGAALVDYLCDVRPGRRCREVFVRLRAPAGPIGATAVSEAFHRAWTHHGAPSIPRRGPHCLRHSLAVHLLRQGTSVKAIGDLLGHRSAESTCVYLRLQVEDLRDAALALPQEARA
jgi:site-specific recombinase XerD